MRLPDTANVLCCALLLCAARPLLTQSPTALDSLHPDGRHLLTADISLHEFGNSFAPWNSKHPELATSVIHNGPALEKGNTSYAFKLTYPALDIYSAAGAPLYYSDAPEESRKVLDALPRAIPEPDLNPKYEVRPSLRELLSMIPAMPRRAWATPPGIDYTVVSFVLRHAVPGADPAMDKAIQKEKSRPIPPDIHLVRLPSTPEEDSH